MHHNYATQSGSSLPGADAPRGRCKFSRWLLLCLVAGGGFSAFGQTQTLSPARNATHVDPATNISAVGGPLTWEALTGMRVFSHQYGGRRTGTTSVTAGSNVTFNPAVDFKPGETVFTTLLPVGGLRKQVYQFTTAAGAGPGTFSGGSDVTMGFQSQTVVPADVDGDGDLDVLTANVSTSRVEIALNDGSGGLGSITQVPVGASPLSIAAADVDGDGDLDLMTANARANTASIRFNNGSGVFSGEQNVAVGQSPFAVAAADVDADGDLDLLAANFSGNSVSVRLNNGVGSFSGNYNAGFGDGHGPMSLAAADLDNDGDLDVVTANGVTRVLAVLPGNGDGTFGSPAYLPVGEAPRSVAAADLDRDGDLDLLSANTNSSTISVRRNNGGLSFSAAADVPAASGLRHMTTADVDGDGDPDLLAACFASASTVIVRLNDGSGSFTSGPTVSVGDSPYGIAAADMDGDGDLDLLTGNYGGTTASTVSVRLNQPLWVVVTNQEINKPNGLEDQPVTFTAADFTAAFSPAGTLAKVRFVSLPPTGTLKLGVANVAVNQEIPVGDLGALTYVPAPDFEGAVSFLWNGSNGITYARVAAQVNITLAPVNDPPTLTDIHMSGTEDTDVTFFLTDFINAFNDVDPTGILGLARVRIASLPANGQLMLLDKEVFLNQEIQVLTLQSLRYVPHPNFNGNDAFAWNGSDGALYAISPAKVHLTIAAVNDAPVLAGVPASVQVDELVPFTFQATATDPDGTDSPLTFSLAGEPAGAAINPATGAFAWTPTEAQGAGGYSFRVKVSNGAAEAEQIVSVVVREVNAAPVLAPIGNKEMDENSTLTFPVSATDPDEGRGAANQLTYEVTGADGAQVNSDGVFTWTTQEKDGPGTVTVKVRVYDNAVPPLDDAEEFTITIREVNQAPQLHPITYSPVFNEGTTLAFTAEATDPDLPGTPLTFSLEGAPEGAVIHPTTGAFSWTPTEAQGPQDYVFLVKVSDGAAEDMQSITVTVNEVNQPPVLKNVPIAVTLDEQTELTFAAAATEDDLPENTLVFSLENAPAGAVIHPATGAFSWTPTEAQGPGSYTFKVRVTDNGTPAGSDEAVVTVTVQEANAAPVLSGVPATVTIPWQETLSFQATAADTDLPANLLGYSLVWAPDGAAIHPATGAFSWTPTAGQVGTYAFRVRVTDNGAPSLSDEKQIAVTVTGRPTALVYSGGVSGQYSDNAALRATLLDVTHGLPGVPVAGKTIAFALGDQSASAVTGPDGVAAAVLKLTQPAANATVLSTFAGDDQYGESSDADAFLISKEDAGVVYSGLEYFATANASSSVANVEYVATLTDGADGSRGTIANARVVFSGNPVRTADVSPLHPADPTVGGARTGVFTEKLTSSEYSSGGKTYPVEVSAGGDFYTGQAVETTLITVAVPGSDYVNGGGNLIIAQSVGTYAATAGSKMNFGFTMKWNKSGKNIQGQANIIFRRLVNGAWRTYQIKSNAINTLGTFNVAGGRRADFNTKANITDVTDPLAPVSLDGGLDLSVQAFESTDRDYKDRISVTVRNRNVLVFSSFWNGAAPEMKPLNGGAVRVRSSAAITTTTARAGESAAAQTAEAPASFSVNAYPNPFASRFYLSIGSEVTGEVTLRVVDGKGRTLLTRQVAKAAGPGSRTVEIDLAGEPHGVYHLHVASGAGREVIKVFKIDR